MTWDERGHPGTNGQIRGWKNLYGQVSCPGQYVKGNRGLNDIQCFNQGSDDRNQGQGDHGREKHVYANGKSEGKEEKHPVTAGGFLIH